jgi:hypothetical protein
MTSHMNWPVRDELTGRVFHEDDVTDVTKATWADEDQKQRKIMSWPG